MSHQVAGSNFNLCFQATLYLDLAMNEVTWLGSVRSPGSIRQLIKTAKGDFFLHSQSVAQSDSEYKNTWRNHKNKPFKESRGKKIKYHSTMKYWNGILSLTPPPRGGLGVILKSSCWRKQSGEKQQNPNRQTPLKMITNKKTCQSSHDPQEQSSVLFWSLLGYRRIWKSQGCALREFRHTGSPIVVPLHPPRRFSCY